MKRIWTALLLVYVALTLCACGAKTADASRAPDAAVETNPIDAQWADEVDLSLFDGYGEFTASDDPEAPWIVFAARRAVRDFKVLSVAFVDADEEGRVIFDTEELYAQETLTPEHPLLVRVSFPGDMPANGISFVADSGETVYYSVSESGMDGSLVMSAFEAAAG